ncbi:MAG TPA: F0F1 ATP synthase subunit alpha, partial [Firmicutes bacterium]|nr:F0F1 ATP synthase subunit alpha [Bacillota bacterium]
KQPEAAPMPVEEQVVVLYVGVNGHLDDTEVDRVTIFTNEFVRYLRESRPEILKKIRTEAELKPDTVQALEDAIAEFKRVFS